VIGEWTEFPDNSPVTDHHSQKIFAARSSRALTPWAADLAWPPFAPRSSIFTLCHAHEKKGFPKSFKIKSESRLPETQARPIRL
jgi:hypothetical protein